MTSSVTAGYIEQATSPPEDADASPLLRLPAELRDRIYEFALSHEEGGGIISPVPVIKPHSTPRGPIRWMTVDPTPGQSGFMTLKGPNRFRVKNGKPASYYMEMTAGGQKAMTERDHELKAAWAELPMCEQGHVCTLRCLKQPALTKVSSQIRSEALPVFYRANKFHIEAINFFKAKDGFNSGPKGLPQIWWRAVGDTNLRMIRSLNLFGQSEFGEIFDRGVMIKYRKQPMNTHITRTSEKVHDEDQPASMPEIDQIQRGSQQRLEMREAELQKVLEIVKTDGLHVRALEHMLALLEPFRGAYAPDRSTLEGLRTVYSIND